jgi:hypothetical protein
MGQAVVINNAVVMGDLLLVDTDRSFTGQDGVAATRDEPGVAVPGKVAARLFELDAAIDHVFVLQNSVTVRRRSGWDEQAKSGALAAIEGFLLFY